MNEYWNDFRQTFVGGQKKKKKKRLNHQQNYSGAFLCMFYNESIINEDIR